MIRHAGLPMDFLDGWHLSAQVFRNTVAQSIPNNVDTVVTYQTEGFDQGGMVDLAVNNDRIVIRQHGVYEILARILWDGLTITGDRRAKLLVNGASVWGNRIRALVTVSAGNTLTPFIMTTLALAPNDYVQIAAFQNASGGVSLDMTNAVLSIGKCARKAG